MALWGGRFTKETDKTVALYTESVSYDQRLYPYDIQGSIAHVTMLAKQGIIPAAEGEKIIEQLQQIKHMIDDGKFDFSIDLEDVHMNIESELIRRLPEFGGKVHTGRSRNDQIQTDMRLYLRHECEEIHQLLTEMQRSLVETASQNSTLILPGFTHLQHAQPILLAHHLLAYVEMLERDKGRIADCQARLNVSPLGAGAIAGSTLPLNREMTADLLGFSAPLQNSMDAVADRDYIIELLSAISIIAIHFSRLSEDIILWNSQEFGFIELDDAFTTGSSLMPQKKNPDVAELTRGKSGRIIGALMGMITTLKGLPLTYNRDLQEDKEGLFDAIDTIKLMLQVYAPMMISAKFNGTAMLQCASDPALMATDLAEYLVRLGVPFRDAHHRVGRFVSWCKEHQRLLNQVSLDEMKETIPEADQHCLELFAPEKSVNARNITGGTAPEQVLHQLQSWQAKLSN